MPAVLRHGWRSLRKPHRTSTTSSLHARRRSHDQSDLGLKLVNPTPTPHVVGHGNEQVFEVVYITPSAMCSCEASQPRRDAILDEQAGTVSLVLVAGAGEFSWV